MPSKSYVRRGRPRTDREGRGRGKRLYGKPRIDPPLKKVFQKIGVPPSEPFHPDPFQRQALEQIRDRDVLVSAPTGAGKTWVAAQAIHTYLARNLRVWYASPLKALSNSIYYEFRREFGPELCGILTGDRKENPQAPIIVGTTEILRNQLYDSMQAGTSIQSDLVILDEAHYLSDPERGVVWEEVLIYLPSRVKLLLLSATVSNAEEVSAWLRHIRRTPCTVVRADERPVPLEMLFLFPDGLVSHLGGTHGLNPKVKKFLAGKSKSRRRGREKIPFGDIISCLRGLRLLPAIFFLKSRAGCDRAIRTCPAVEQKPQDRERLKAALLPMLEGYPYLKDHRQMDALVESRVGSHHGGQLPLWKSVIEQMMNGGSLEAIFSTSTVAAGVNFPARTVILLQSDRYNGREFVDLTAMELHQMVGRAGRRGKDRIGFGVVVPGLYQDPRLICDLKDSPPEPLVSQIHINFSMTLNLLLSHTPLEVKELLEKSFASFQERDTERSAQREWEHIVSRLQEALPRGKCDTGDPYEVLENIQKRRELQKEAQRLVRRLEYESHLNTLKKYLKPGRLFLHRSGGVYALFHTTMRGDRLLCSAYPVGPKRNRSRNRLRLKKVDVNQIKKIYDYRVDLQDDESPERLEGKFGRIPFHTLEELALEKPEQSEGDEALEAATRSLNGLPCEGCSHFKACHLRRKSDVRQLLKGLRSLALQMHGLGEGLWLSFKRHLRFLKETGFVEEADQLTPDGRWASKLRLDQPLLIAEAIRKGAFEGLDPELLAGGLAPFVWDRAQDVELRVPGHIDLTRIERAFQDTLSTIEGIRSLKSKRGFENPPVMFWPAAAIAMWSEGLDWEQLTTYVPVDEGDMASLVMRTADHLRQVTNLEETHPDLAWSAREAVGRILREPVYLP